MEINFLISFSKIFQIRIYSYINKATTFISLSLLVLRPRFQSKAQCYANKCVDYLIIVVNPFFFSLLH